LPLSVAAVINLSPPGLMLVLVSKHRVCQFRIDINNDIRRKEVMFPGRWLKTCWQKDIGIS